MNQTGGDLTPNQESTTVLWQGALAAHEFRLIAVTQSNPEPGEPASRFVVEEIIDGTTRAMNGLSFIEGHTEGEILSWIAAGVFQSGTVRGRRGILDALQSLADKCPGLVSHEVRQVSGMLGTPIMPAIHYLESKVPVEYRRAVNIAFAGGKFFVSLTVDGFSALQIGSGVDTEQEAEAIAAQASQALAALCGREPVAQAGANS